MEYKITYSITTCRAQQLTTRDGETRTTDDQNRFVGLQEVGKLSQGRFHTSNAAAVAARTWAAHLEYHGLGPSFEKVGQKFSHSRYAYKFF